LRSDGELNQEYPSGLEMQSVLLKDEGHIIEPGKGEKPPKVKDFEKIPGSFIVNCSRLQIGEDAGFYCSLRVQISSNLDL
jgi:hypothetical protein